MCQLCAPIFLISPRLGTDTFHCVAHSAKVHILISYIHLRYEIWNAGGR